MEWVLIAKGILPQGNETKLTLTQALAACHIHYTPTTRALLLWE